MSELDAKQIANNITIVCRIKRERQMRWRMFIGRCLIQLAAWFMWMNVTFPEAEGK